VAYPILDPKYSDPACRSICALAIMAKAPRPGKVKTRLSPPLTPQEAAAINTCFLRDMTTNISVLIEGLLPAGYSLVPQRGGGFGERLLTTAQDLFQCGFASVCLIDSDSPTVPTEVFAMAVDALQRSGDRIVLGPSHDGGYYLIGMKQAHAAPFENISWSTALVLEETVAAVQKMGVELITLPLWYDVDDAESLSVLRAELIEGIQPAFTSLPGYSAEHTRRFLKQLVGAA
jgi:glycosyltransferase A (GT-A) superfamily protein (DUF2064 family)